MGRGRRHVRLRAAVVRRLGGAAARLRPLRLRLQHLGLRATQRPGRPSRARSPSSATRRWTSSPPTTRTTAPLKALCEAEVERVFGERALVVRPGLIVGPHDPTAASPTGRTGSRAAARSSRRARPSAGSSSSTSATSPTGSSTRVERGSAASSTRRTRASPGASCSRARRSPGSPTSFLREHERRRVDGAAALARRPGLGGHALDATSAAPSRAGLRFRPLAETLAGAATALRSTASA